MATTRKESSRTDRKPTSSAARDARTRERAARAGQPSSEDWAFYIGLGAVAAIGFIDWPVAFVIAGGHLLKARARSRVVEEVIEGVESGV